MGQANEQVSGLADEPWLHSWRIEDREYERHEQRRGRRHAFESISAQRTALVVVDMVPFFVSDNPFTRGIVPNRLWPGLQSSTKDLMVQKTASSAFFPSRCDLHGLLEERGIDTVIVVGTMADVYCASSVRDARTLGYRVIVAADAVSAGSDEVLNSTLRTIYRSFGDVRSAAEIFDLIKQGSGLSK